MKGGRGAGLPKRREPGEIEKNFVIFCDRNGTKGRKHEGKGRKPGVQDTGSGRLRPHYPPHPPPPPTEKHLFLLK